MKSKSTKKALTTSIISILLCLAMFIGSTFAWFTDTASTSVNTIKAGTLDVALQMKNPEYTGSGNTSHPEWISAEGKVLTFKTADNRTADKILWEPGCTYELPELRIINNGNLALKYKVQISGIVGDENSTKLLKVIDFSAKVGSDDVPNLDSWEGELAAGAMTDEITIKGAMQTTAGNEYQGLSIDGIAITVYATQDTGEYDSTSNEYDEDATYNYKSATIISDADGKTTTLELGKSYTVGAATVEVNENGNITYTNTTGPAQTVSITTEGGILTINAPSDTVKHYGSAERVDITAVASHSYHEFGEAGILKIAKGRVVVENGNNVSVLQVEPEGNDVPVVAVPQNVVLNAKLEVKENTKVEVAVIDSNGEKIESESFTIAQTGTEVNNVIPAELEKVLNKDGDGKVAFDTSKTYTAIIGTKPYENFASAVEAAKEGETIKLMDNVTIDSKDYDVNNRLNVVANNITINLNKKTLTIPNYTLILKGDNITLTNGEIKTTTTNSSQTYGSYAVVPSGKDITISNVKMLGGVSATGNNSGNSEPDATVTIKNCEITATNYYTVCAQSNAEATIENTKLIGGKGAFFWVEEKGYHEGNDPLANVSSKIIYDAKTVTFVGDNALYNPVGVAIVAKNLTVQDADGEDKTIDAIAVSNEDHLRTLLAAEENVMLASDITLTSPITIGKTSTNDKTIAIVGNGHELTANYTGANSRAINVWDGTDMTVIIKDLTVVGPEKGYTCRGISTGYTKNLKLVLDGCDVSTLYYALNIYGDTNPEIIVRNTTIANDTIQGYCAFQTFVENTKATFENCKLVGYNVWSGNNDNFATIVTTGVTNSTLNFKNCHIEAITNGKADEYFLAVQDSSGTTAGTSNVNVTFDGCKFYKNGTEVSGDTAIKQNMAIQSGTTITIK